jgi:serine/threonine protein kinase
MHPSGPEQVFISYSHKDVQWKDEFQRMLAPARERGLISLWSDESIPAGENWHQNIQKALETSRVGLLLVTDHFLDSRFITKEELAQLLGAAKNGTCSVRWVPVSACLYNLTPLGELQACWDPKRPLDELPPAERKAAIQKICIQIVEEFGVHPKVSVDRRETLRAQVQARLGERYAILDEVATGKFSIVYRAQGAQPKRVVSVKTFVASELDDWARHAFVAGVARAVELTSPAFIRIFDNFMEASPEFLVSEFIEGEQLNKLLSKHPDGFPLYKVRSILLDLSRAIEEAHAHGWQRGEMCPSDILLEDSGLPRLSPVDFSNVLREQSQIAGNFLVDRESLCYMTPERYYGHARTELTDQYSLGLLATELLGGPRLPRVINPCDLESKSRVFSELEAGEGDWARRSPEFTGVVCRMLRVDPEGRWPSMKAVTNVLREIEVSESPEEVKRRIATTSYIRLQAGGVSGERKLYGSFYRHLFADAPDVQAHFRSIDMDRQYQILNRSIYALLEFRAESKRSQDQLQQIAAQHVRFGLTRKHYDVFLEAFLKTIREVGETDLSHLQAWRETLSRGIDFLWQCQETLAAGAVAPTERGAQAKKTTSRSPRKKRKSGPRPSSTPPA